MSETTEAARRVSQPLIPPFLPRMIHRLALPIVLIWLGIVFVTNTVAPQLEVVSKNHSVSQSPKDAPSFQSMMRVGKTFNEFNSDASAMVLLEGDKPLGAEAHRYYDEIVKRLEQDKKHVQHIQDFWSDPLTAAGSQSHDQKAAYVQVYLSGNMGGGLSTESTEAVRKIVNSVPAPPGINLQCHHRPVMRGARKVPRNAALVEHHDLLFDDGRDEELPGLRVVVDVLGQQSRIGQTEPRMRCGNFRLVARNLRLQGGAQRLELCRVQQWVDLAHRDKSPCFDQRPPGITELQVRARDFQRRVR